MAKGDILLSPQYGVNPSVELCWLCGESMGVILFGKMKRDKEAPPSCTLGHVCKRCQTLMELGIIMALSKDGKNPAGSFVVIKEEAFKRIVNADDLREYGLKHRLVLVDDEVFAMLQPPKEGDEQP
jgi:hypothetical protein